MSALDFALRSLVLAVALLTLVRVIGKRLVGEVAAVDLVVAITVGTIAGSTSISPKVPLWGGLLALGVWGAFEWLGAFASSRSPFWESLTSGRGTTLVQEGAVRPRGLRHAMVSENALRSMLRAHRVSSVDDVQEAVLEPSGKLGIVPRTKPGA